MPDFFPYPMTKRKSGMATRNYPTIVKRYQMSYGGWPLFLEIKVVKVAVVY